MLKIKCIEDFKTKPGIMLYRYIENGSFVIYLFISYLADICYLSFMGDV